MFNPRGNLPPKQTEPNAYYPVPCGSFQESGPGPGSLQRQLPPNPHQMLRSMGSDMRAGFPEPNVQVTQHRTDPGQASEEANQQQQKKKARVSRWDNPVLPGNSSSSQPVSERIVEQGTGVHSHYTNESVSTILASFGLSSEDLEELSLYPDDQLTPENMPLILRNIQRRKMAHQLPSLPSQSREKEAFRSDDGRGSMVKSKVIDYGHESKYAYIQGPLNIRVYGSDVPTEGNVEKFQGEQTASVSDAPSSIPSSTLNAAEELKQQVDFQRSTSGTQPSISKVAVSKVFALKCNAAVSGVPPTTQPVMPPVVPSVPQPVIPPVVQQTLPEPPVAHPMMPAMNQPPPPFAPEILETVKRHDKLQQETRGSLPNLPPGSAGGQKNFQKEGGDPIASPFGVVKASWLPAFSQADAQKMKRVPTSSMMNDYYAASPRIFPHMCSLCNVECTDLQDWIQHQNATVHIESCRQLCQHYPDWNPEAHYSPKRHESDRKEYHTPRRRSGTPSPKRSRRSSSGHGRYRSRSRSRSRSPGYRRTSRPRSRSPRYVSWKKAEVLAPVSSSRHRSRSPHCSRNSSSHFRRSSSKERGLRRSTRSPGDAWEAAVKGSGPRFVEQYNKQKSLQELDRGASRARRTLPEPGKTLGSAKNIPSDSTKPLKTSKRDLPPHCGSSDVKMKPSEVADVSNRGDGMMAAGTDKTLPLGAAAKDTTVGSQVPYNRNKEDVKKAAKDVKKSPSTKKASSATKTSRPVAPAPSTCKTNVKKPREPQKHGGVTQADVKQKKPADAKKSGAKKTAGEQKKPADAKKSGAKKAAGEQKKPADAKKPGVAKAAVEPKKPVDLKKSGATKAAGEQKKPADAKEAKRAVENKKTTESKKAVEPKAEETCTPPHMPDVTGAVESSEVVKSIKAEVVEREVTEQEPRKESPDLKKNPEGSGVVHPTAGPSVKPFEVKEEPSSSVKTKLPEVKTEDSSTETVVCEAAVKPSKTEASEGGPVHLQGPSSAIVSADLGSLEAKSEEALPLPCNLKKEEEAIEFQSNELLENASTSAAGNGSQELCAPAGKPSEELYSVAKTESLGATSAIIAEGKGEPLLLDSAEAPVEEPSDGDLQSSKKQINPGVYSNVVSASVAEVPAAKVGVVTDKEDKSPLSTAKVGLEVGSRATAVETREVTKEKTELQVVEVGAAEEKPSEVLVLDDGTTKEKKLNKDEMEESREPILPKEQPNEGLGQGQIEESSKASMLGVEWAPGREATSASKSILKALMSVPNISKATTSAQKEEPKPALKVGSRSQAAAEKKVVAKEASRQRVAKKTKLPVSVVSELNTSPPVKVGSEKSSSELDKESRAETKGGSKQPRERERRSSSGKPDDDSVNKVSTGRNTRCSKSITPPKEGGIPHLNTTTHTKHSPHISQQPEGNRRENATSSHSKYSRPSSSDRVRQQTRSRTRSPGRHRTHRSRSRSPQRLSSPKRQSRSPQKSHHSSSHSQRSSSKRRGLGRSTSSSGSPVEAQYSRERTKSCNKTEPPCEKPEHQKKGHTKLDIHPELKEAAASREPQHSKHEQVEGPRDVPEHLALAPLAERSVLQALALLQPAGTVGGGPIQGVNLPPLAAGQLNLAAVPPGLVSMIQLVATQVVQAVLSSQPSAAAALSVPPSAAAAPSVPPSAAAAPSPPPEKQELVPRSIPTCSVVAPERKVVWICGHNLVYWAREHALKTGMGAQLGLDDSLDIKWLIREEMRWEELVPMLQEEGERHGPPYIILLQLGENDLCARSAISFNNAARDDLDKCLHWFPGVKIIWSELLARPTWKGAGGSKKGVNVRKKINEVMGSYVTSHGGTAVTHSLISERGSELYQDDGLHLTEKGNDIWLDNVRSGLLRLLQLPPSLEKEEDENGKEALDPVMLNTVAAYSERMQGELKQVLICGSSIILEARERAKSSSIGLELGLVSIAKVDWFCQRDLCWDQLLPALLPRLEVDPRPQVLLLHLGENDLDKRKDKYMISKWLLDLAVIRDKLPGVAIVWSYMLQRRFSQGTAKDISAYNKIRKMVNKRFRLAVEVAGGSAIPHTCILSSIPHLYHQDGMHLSDTGYDIFLRDLQHGLRDFICYRFE